MNTELNIYNCSKPNVCFIGDIHGHFGNLKKLMKQTEFRDTVYIICGDCGFGFEKENYYIQILKSLDKTAEKYNCEFIFVRGNHDDPSYFDLKKINNERYKTVPDYTVIKTSTHNILCIGGAVSVDRKDRLISIGRRAYKYARYHNVSFDKALTLVSQCYWKDEIPLFNGELLKELKRNNINIDIVCTHTCPSFVYPITKSGITEWMQIDAELEKDVDTERKVMDDIYNTLMEDEHPIKYWVYGHYHNHNSEEINGITFITLGMYRNNKFDIFDVR